MIHPIKAIHHFFNFIGKSFKNFAKHDMIERSGYIAFLAILSSLPFIIFTLSLASFFNRSEFGERAVDYIYYATPEELEKLIQPVISQFESGKMPFLTLSTIILIYTASTIIQAARKGFQRIFVKKDQIPNIILFRIQSIGLMLLLCVGLYVISAISLILPAIEHIVEDLLQIQIQNIDFYKQIAHYSTIFITFLCILIFYKALAPRSVPLKIHLIGAIIATSVIIPTANALQTYVHNAARYNIIYGSLSSIIVALIAMQIFTAIFFWAAEINGIIYKYFYHLKNEDSLS